ncbi:hypothetical protein NA29_09545 [Pandoraea sputorum]|nr:hypothetical protein NA29_09545 [Pandoraea sputorum]
MRTNAAASILPCDAISGRAAPTWRGIRGQVQSGDCVIDGVCTDSANNRTELFSFVRFHAQIAVIDR